MKRIFFITITMLLLIACNTGKQITTNTISVHFTQYNTWVEADNGQSEISKLMPCDTTITITLTNRVCNNHRIINNISYTYLSNDSTEIEYAEKVITAYSVFDINGVIGKTYIK